MPLLAPADAPIHEDLARLLEELDSPPITITPVRQPGSPRLQGGAFRIRLSDGRQIKASVLEGRGQAERTEYFLGRLDHRAFPRVLGRRGRALLIEWVDGEPITGYATAAVFERCAALHASLHLEPLPDDCPYSISDLPLLRQKLDSDLRCLTECGAVGAADAQRASEVALRFLPRSCDTGIVHRDLCPENLVLRSDGGVSSIDNESICLGAHDFDLARTWYRWPMERAERRLYLDTYALRRDIGPFVAHFPFWAVAVLADSTRLRLRAGADVLSVPVERLDRLLGALQGGVAAEELVFET